MVEKIHLTGPSEPITLDQFIAMVDAEKCDYEDHSCLVGLAPKLSSLCQNKSFFIEAMFAELRDIGNFQSRNLYGPAVFMLYSCKDYFIRANVWRPISKLESKVQSFRYDICHDHNFDILTAGYFGPGYRARTYEYDFGSVDGVLGERVSMTPTGVVTLATGEVMLYKAKRDIHIQLPPESLSISINLIPRNSWIERPQYQFDEDRGTICRYLHNSSAELIVRLAGLLGDSDAIEMLSKIRLDNASPHVRALAAVSELSLDPANADTVMNWLHGATAAEQFIFARELAVPGSCLLSIDEV